jgi:hypothetical protein
MERCGGLALELELGAVAPHVALVFLLEPWHTTAGAMARGGGSSRGRGGGGGSSRGHGGGIITRARRCKEVAVAGFLVVGAVVVGKLFWWGRR